MFSTVLVISNIIQFSNLNLLCLFFPKMGFPGFKGAGTKPGQSEVYSLNFKGEFP